MEINHKIQLFQLYFTTQNGCIVSICVILHNITLSFKQIVLYKIFFKTRKPFILIVYIIYEMKSRCLSRCVLYVPVTVCMSVWHVNCLYVYVAGLRIFVGNTFGKNTFIFYMLVFFTEMKHNTWLNYWKPLRSSNVKLKIDETINAIFGSLSISKED